MALSPFLIGIIGVVLFIIFLFLEMPIGASLVVVGFLGIWAILGLNQAFGILMTVPFRISVSYVWSLVPLFIFMGLIAFQGGLGLDLYKAFSKWFGHFRGGLAMTTLATAAGFGAVCGDTLAAGVTMTTVCLPEMRRYKYDDTLSLACICAGGLLSFLIPPSFAFILYGVITGESVGALFLSGVIPGILLAFLYMITVFILVRINPNRGPAGTRAIWKERLDSLKGLWGVGLLILIVFGGIYTGFITPTEAGGLGAFAAIIVGLAKRRLSWQGFLKAVYETIKTVGMVFFFFIGSQIFAPFLALSTIPEVLLGFMESVPTGLVLFLILLFYLVGGCFIDSVVLLLISLPFIYPIVITLNFDPIWFAVLMILMVDIGGITPPVGLLVYVISGVAEDVPIGKIFLAVTPFIIAIIACVLLVVFFPKLATLLPSLMMMG